MNVDNIFGFFFHLQAGQNRLSKLPASIGLLRKLETLMLNENLLEELPAELGSCQRLTVLSLRKNRLEHIPPEMGHLSRLRVINLSCNRLLHLPVSFLKLPSLTALWLSEAQTKPVVPLQTDTDSSTGHKVLTCFLLPQSTEAETEDHTLSSPSDKDIPSVVAARSPTHIKFAFDGEADHRAGKLMRNPTPYPKELKALAKHAQHIQQHNHPVSPTSRSSVEMTISSSTSSDTQLKKQLSKEPLVVAAVVNPPPSAQSAVPAVHSSHSHIEASVAVVSKLTQENPTVTESTSASLRHKTEVEKSPEPSQQPTTTTPSPANVTLSIESQQQQQQQQQQIQIPPLSPQALAASPLPLSKRDASVENLANAEPEPAKQNGIPTSAELSPRSSEIEIKEARVLRPLMSATDGLKEDKVKNPAVVTVSADVVDHRSSHLDLATSSSTTTPTPSTETKQQPPPYHVAAAYSKRAAEFNQAVSLPRTQSTDSGFTVDGTPVEKRDSSPSRDSGRGPSIEPLEDNNAQPTGNSTSQTVQPVVTPKRPIELPVNGNSLDKEKATPLALKRATYIIDRSLSPTNGTEQVDESADLQSVAALRQAAREVFLSASPRQSPLPAHKQSVWDVPLPPTTSTTSNGSSALSAANVIGLPSAGHLSSENGVHQQPQQPAKIQGRLPPPKYHVTTTTTSSTSNGFRDAPTELKSPPPANASSRIPLASHNRLPSGLPRQLSNLSTSSQLDGPSKPAPTLPPKQKDSPPPPTLLPKLSTSRIPPPQVHTPAINSPLTPVSSKATFSPLPVHSARLVTPVTSPAPTPTNNNEFEVNQSNKTISSSQLPGTTRIPLPKYSVADVGKAGPSPGSRIPTRLPTPTSVPASVPKSKLSADLTASPSLAAYTPRIQ